MPFTAVAQSAGGTQSVVIVGSRPGESQSVDSADATSLLLDKPGVSAYGAGGVSSLPVLRGLADERIKIRIDGAEASAACGNHMNSPLSYVDPTQVTKASVTAGISPVSAGGDNIAGVIEVTTVQPAFAAQGQPLLANGAITLLGRSAGSGFTTSASATLANDTLSITYTGASTQAESYRDGHGNKVLDTQYQSTNQSVTLGARTPDQLWVFKLGEQRIPYQGFPNEFMDMTHNHAVHANLAWDARFDWGALHATAFWQDTEHEMGFFSDERPGMMPMNTHGKDASTSMVADLPVHGGTLKLGAEYHRHRLDDWWPAVDDSMMMGPQAYVNINDGQRDRLGLFGQWDGKLSERWTVGGGVRVESVHMNAGDVQDYGCGMMCADDAAAAATFNASNRRRRDTNVDATLLGRFEPGEQLSYEIGIARKTRSPSLYERYTWGRGTMAMTMIGWFGDANGYLGDVRLKPEVAHTISASADWHASRGDAWSLRITPFYTQVQGFIDADVIGTYQLGMMGGPTRVLLQFANHDAHLYGLNISGQALLASSEALGQTVVQGKLDWTRGQRDDGGDLYHIMPLNLTAALVQAVGGLTARAELQAVARKSRVDARRDEPTTAGYALVHLKADHRFDNGLTLMAGIRNLLDRQYTPPLGGLNIAGYEADGALTPVPGPGRSFELGLSWKF